MINTDTATEIAQGGAFLIKGTNPQSISTHEDYTEEQKMLRQSVLDFIDKKIEPLQKTFDSLEGTKIAPQLLEEMAELGFLGVGVPEEYGGFAANFKTQLAFCEVAFSCYAFGLTAGVQTSLGVAPLLLYGNKEQRAQYLPKIVTAEIKSCYCLTEPSAGSDANSGKSKAVLNEAGTHYILNGQKMWITSAGHADLFFVFAKIDDDPNLSCLIVEKSYGGISLGAEEDKMGIKGSSTRMVFFENVPVPIENLLGERNKGFKIAVNVLNTGRIKLATSVTNNAKKAFKLGINYANEREQFGKAISSFGAIQHKIGEMAANIYAMEAIFCRTASHIDEVRDKLVADGLEILDTKFKSIAEFSIECAIAKVHNSEAESFVIDEALQMHGGMGYSSESVISVHYRNARINRIYEGTNEINRMLIVDMLFRKVMKGKLDLMAPLMRITSEMKNDALLLPKTDGSFFADANRSLQHLKKATLLVAGTAAQKLMTQLKEEQEILIHLANCLIQLYAFESALLRTEKHQDKNLEVRQELTTLLMYKTAAKIAQEAQEALYAFTEGEEAEQLLQAVQTLTHLPPYNLKNARRKVAQYFIEENQYKL